MNKMEELVKNLSAEEWNIFCEHLMGGTSADWLSEELTKHGHQVSATTLKRFRRKARNEEEVAA